MQTIHSQRVLDGGADTIVSNVVTGLFGIAVGKSLGKGGA